MVRPSNSTTPFKIRCRIVPWLEQSSQTHPEDADSHVDTYAIVPSTTLFCEVVCVALLKLGYSMSDTVGAKGWIQIKNWLPLSLDQISASKESTVEDTLADVSSVATLKIKMCSSLNIKTSSITECWNLEHVRKAILWLLQVMDLPQLKLAKLCGLPQPVISNIVNDREVRLSHDKCQTFKEWYKEFVDKEPISMDETTTRISFHQDKEVPLLRAYFKTARYPDDLTLLALSQKLNKQPYRELRARVTPKKLKTWFTQERHKAKFAEKAVQRFLMDADRSEKNLDQGTRNFLMDADRSEKNLDQGTRQNPYLQMEDSNHSEMDPRVSLMTDPASRYFSGPSTSYSQ